VRKDPARQTLLAAIGRFLLITTELNRPDITLTNAYAAMSPAYEEGNDPVEAYAGKDSIDSAGGFS
jgi:hypothetical protein